MHAAPYRAIPLDCLEVDGKPVRGDEAGSHDGQCDAAAGDDDAIEEQPRRDERRIAHVADPAGKGGAQDTRRPEEADEDGRAPCVVAGAAPFQRDEQEGDGGGDEREAHEIERAVQRREDGTHGLERRGVGELDEGGAGEDEGPEREVDVEACCGTCQSVFLLWGLVVLDGFNADLHHRQESLSVRTPPMIGPLTRPSCPTARLYDQLLHILSTVSSLVIIFGALASE